MVQWDRLESQGQLVNLVHLASPELLEQKETWELLEKKEASVFKVHEENLESLEYLESQGRWDHLEKMEVMEKKVDQDHLVHLVLPDFLDQEDNLV